MSFCKCVCVGDVDGEDGGGCDHVENEINAGTTYTKGELLVIENPVHLKKISRNKRD